MRNAHPHEIDWQILVFAACVFTSFFLCHFSLFMICSNNHPNALRAIWYAKQTICIDITIRSVDCWFGVVMYMDVFFCQLNSLSGTLNSTRSHFFCSSFSLCFAFPSFSLCFSWKQPQTTYWNTFCILKHLLIYFHNILSNIFRCFHCKKCSTIKYIFSVLAFLLLFVLEVLKWNVIALCDISVTLMT